MEEEEEGMLGHSSNPAGALLIVTPPLAETCSSTPSWAGCDCSSLYSPLPLQVRAPPPGVGGRCRPCGTPAGGTGRQPRPGRCRGTGKGEGAGRGRRDRGALRTGWILT